MGERQLGLPKELIQRSPEDNQQPEDKIEITEEELTVPLADEQINLSKDEEIDINKEETVDTIKDEKVEFSSEEKRIEKKLPKNGGFKHSLKRGLVSGMTALTMAGAITPNTSRAEDKKELSFTEKMSEIVKNVKIPTEEELTEKLRHTHLLFEKENSNAETPEFIKTVQEKARNVHLLFEKEESYKETSEEKAKRLSELEKIENAEIKNTKAKNAQISKIEKIEKFEIQNRPTHEYHMGALEGKSLGSLFKDYLGTEGKIKETEKINFQTQLEKIWNKKLEVSGDISVVKETGETLLKEYETDDHRIMGIKKYNEEIQKSIDNTKLNWDKVEQIKKLNKEQRQILESVSKSINSDDLTSYMFTEIFPSSNGELNIEVMDFLLRNAGAKYIESLPAIYDNRTSFGPYQITPLALSHTKQGVEGASIINKALDSKKIPDSVSKLRGTDHHQAAYLFAINNFANFIKQLDKKDLEKFKQNWTKHQDGITQFIATAHHLPSYATKDATKWVKDNMKKSYWSYSGETLKKYALKTDANFRGLINWKNKDKQPPKTIASK